MWTRSFIISTASDLGDLKFVVNRLLQNPSDFADLFRKFYGNQKADMFKELFTQHLLIAGDFVNAAKKVIHKKQTNSERSGMQMQMKFQDF